MWLTAPLAVTLALNPHLEEGRRLYEQLKYPEAEARLVVAQQSPANTTDEQAQIADLLARARIAQGRAAEAERTWAELLEKQPHTADPAGASPKIRDVFLKAKRSVYPDGFVRLERRPAAPGRWEAELIDPWRKVATVAFAGQPQAEGRRFAGELPVGTSVLEARDAGGKVVASLDWTRTEVAVPAVPISVEQAPKGPTRWPAVLTSVLAAAGIAAGTALVISAARDHGQVTPETPALETRALDAQVRTKSIGAYVAFGGALAAGAGTAIIVWSW